MKVKALKIFGISALAVALLVGCFGYYRYTNAYPTSDDAYVKANIVYLKSQVTGTIATVNVENYQPVKAGQLLFTIDPSSYEYARDQAKALYLLDQSKVGVLLAQVKVADAELKKAQADLFLAKENNDRVSALVNNHQASPQEGDQAKGAYLSAQAEVLAKEENRDQAQKNVSVGEHQLEVSQANLKTAELNLSYTQVYAPTSGQLAQLTLRPGSLVNSGDTLVSIVENGSWWVEVNYKETQLGSIHAGQPSEIQLDMYSGHSFTGKVVEVSPSSGATFSLLPPENATGNWVKVVQRYPVKVSLILTPEEKTHYPLRVGASSTVKVDVTQ
jgi:membrane fusion protein (multidrug efflux system)